MKAKKVVHIKPLQEIDRAAKFMKTRKTDQVLTVTASRSKRVIEVPISRDEMEVLLVKLRMIRLFEDEFQLQRLLG